MTTGPSWRFLTNHGNALLCIAREPDAGTRDIADQINRHGHLRHPLFEDFDIGPLVDILYQQ